jgi:hypothetical protein
MFVRVALTDINVQVYFPPILPILERIINGGTGFLTLAIDLPVGGVSSVTYTLEVNNGTQINAPRVGEVVVASGKDSEGRQVVPPVKLETVSVGPPAVFRGSHT